MSGSSKTGLPVDVLMVILSYLPFVEAARAALLNREFRKASGRETLWSTACKKSGYARLQVLSWRESFAAQSVEGRQFQWRKALQAMNAVADLRCAGVTELQTMIEDLEATLERIKTQFVIELRKSHPWSSMSGIVFVLTVL
jgi:hypothetical protein